jgi:hypothetical protein
VTDPLEETTYRWYRLYVFVATLVVIGVVVGLWLLA